MNIASVIYNLIFLIQCSGGAPCCLAGTCCGDGGPCGGVLPPGGPIDDYIIFLFIAALVYGLYVIKKRQSKLN